MSNFEPRQQQTLTQVLEERAARLGEQPWIVCGAHTVSFGAMHRRSSALANGLAGLGIDTGDTVLLMLPDDLAMITAWCALARLGAIEVPVNTRLRGNVLAHIINDSRADTLIVDAGYFDQLVAVADQLETLRRLVLCGDHGAVPASLERFERLRFDDLFTEREPSQRVGPRYLDLKAVMYTSGTTGPSKGVMITHTHAYEYALGVVELLELRAEDVYYNPLPLFHIAGQWAAVYACLIAGATVVIPQAFTLSGFLA